ncbi:aminotransferase class V-fold PLP-dependent enzyme, partial [Hungatella sp.]|uniref:cysteine desulfurase family protein n=1 Tax=Hungatella sp. TaxID=2613924 RepID=UPI002A81BEE6
MIYLDYSANTPVDPAVLEAFCKAEQTYIGNPNSTHCAGLTACEEMARVTDHIAGLLGVEPAGIIYTSGASESNNLAIKGIAQASRSTGRHMISTVLEHASVGGTLTALQQQGWEVDLLDIQRDGTIDLEQLGDLLRKDTILVSVCAVDSELGTVQPIRQITEILKDFPNCRLHVDATQAIGKTELVMDGVDTMSIAPHKFYGLNGSGLLLKKSSVIIEPQIHGGSSTTLYRSGTPALALAVSIEKALQLTLTQQEERIRCVRQLNEYLKTALLHYPSVRINSPEGAVPHILN